MKLRAGRMAIVGVSVVMVAAVFTGCGGSDDDSGALSKEDFIAQADQICADFKDESNAFEGEFNAALEQEDFEAAADLFGETVDQMNEAIDELAALTPPEEDQETIDEFVSLSRDQAAVAGDLEEAIRAVDEQALQALDEEVSALEAESDAIADEYGMVDCGSAGDEDSSMG